MADDKQADVDDNPSRTDRRITILERRVGAIQSQRRFARGPWYRDAAILVSITAFSFSAGTTLFSYYQGRAAERRARYAEFRDVMNDLTGVPLEFLPVEERAKADKQLREYVDEIRGVREAFLNAQAFVYLSTSDNLATAVEYLEVARALSGPGTVQKKKALYTRVVDIADNPEDVILAYRRLGGLSFDVQDFGAARGYFAKALEIPGIASYGVHQIEASLANATTEFYWSREELREGECVRAEERAYSGLRHFKSIPEGLGVGIHRDLKELVRNIRRRCEH